VRRLVPLAGHRESIMTALAYAIVVHSSRAPITAPAVANRVEIDLVLYVMGALALVALVVLLVIVRRLHSRTTRPNPKLPILSLVPLGARPLLSGSVGQPTGSGKRRSDRARTLDM
jgi:hypothetical protein